MLCREIPKQQKSSRKLERHTPLYGIRKNEPSTTRFENYSILEQKEFDIVGSDERFVAHCRATAMSLPPWQMPSCTLGNIGLSWQAVCHEGDVSKTQLLEVECPKRTVIPC